jgi:hypothetical protein
MFFVAGLVSARSRQVGRYKPPCAGSGPNELTWSRPPNIHQNGTNLLRSRTRDMRIDSPLENRQLSQIFVSNTLRLFIEKIDALGCSNTGVEPVVQNESHILPACLTDSDSLAGDVHEAEVNKLQNVLIKSIIVANLSQESVLPFLFYTEIFYLFQGARKVFFDRFPWNVYLQIFKFLTDHLGGCNIDVRN